MLFKCRGNVFQIVLECCGHGAHMLRTCCLQNVEHMFNRCCIVVHIVLRRFFSVLYKFLVAAQMLFALHAHFFQMLGGVV